MCIYIYIYIYIHNIHILYIYIYIWRESTAAGFSFQGPSKLYYDIIYHIMTYYNIVYCTILHYSILRQRQRPRGQGGGPRGQGGAGASSRTKDPRLSWIRLLLGNPLEGQSEPRSRSHLSRGPPKWRCPSLSPLVAFIRKGDRDAIIQ